MSSFLSLSKSLPILLAVAIAPSASLSAQSKEPVAGNAPSVRLETHNGKTMFYLGEPIRLDLIFENDTGTPFMLNTTVYGDLSEKVEITPAKGWFVWQTQSGHDYSTQAKLGDAPVRIPVDLDEGFVFREPGEYRVHVTTARLMSGAILGGSSLPAATTNDVTIELKTMPTDVEASKLATIRSDLVSAGKDRRGDELRQNAMHRLAALQGDEALLEKINLLEAGDEDFRRVYREAFATTHDLQRQLALLTQAWTNPKLTPEYDTPDALYETRLLLTGRNLPGWQMSVMSHPPDDVEKQLGVEHRADMVALLDSMPQRMGEGRTMGAYYLIEFGGLNDAQHARAVDYAIEEFPLMDDTAQHMLLETARPPIRDPRLVPLLRAMLAKNPSDKDVTAALLAMEPTESATWITKSVCAPKGVVLLDTFKEASVDRVPETDTCLSQLLRVAPTDPRAEFEWKQRATQAARFATPAILSALREGWERPEQDSAVLAVLMRDDPTGAVKLLNQETAGNTFNGMLFFETESVYKQIPKEFPPEVLAWLRTKLKSGNNKEASTAAYALSIGGDASDAPRVEERLERLRTQNEGQVAEVQQAEMELASALGTYESKMFLDEARRHQLGQGCMSDQCRLYLH